MSLQYFIYSEKLNIEEVIQVAKEVFPFADWKVREQLDSVKKYVNVVQFYDVNSLLRFSINYFHTLFFSNDNIEGTRYFLENVETLTIKELLLEAKQNYL
jgi:hypothetical protein